MAGWRDNLALGWRRGSAIRAKEWIQIRRDPSTFGLVVVLPIMLMFLFGYAVSLDTRGTRIALIDQDRSLASRDMAASFHANSYFRVAQMTGRPQAQAALVRGDISAFMVIPEGFEAELLAARPPGVQMITDGSVPNTALIASNQAQGLMQSWVRQRLFEQGRGDDPRAAAPPIGTNIHFVYNAELESRYVLVPGAVAIVMAMIGTMLTALVMSREYERGTMEGVLATPIGIAGLVLNKIIPYFVLGMGSMLLCVGVAVFVYGLPFHGSMLALLLLSAAFLTAALGQGLLISAGTKNQFVSTQFGLLLGFMPSLLLSGFLFEIDSMPQPIQWLTYVVPARYLIPSIQTVFLVGDIWSLFWPAIATLLGFGAFFFWRVTKAIKRTIA